MGNKVDPGGVRATATTEAKLEKSFLSNNQLRQMETLSNQQSTMAGNSNRSNSCIDTAAFPVSVTAATVL